MMTFFQILIYLLHRINFYLKTYTNLLIQYVYLLHFSCFSFLIFFMFQLRVSGLPTNPVEIWKHTSSSFVRGKGLTHTPVSPSGMPQTHTPTMMVYMVQFQIYSHPPTEYAQNRRISLQQAPSFNPPKSKSKRKLSVVSQLVTIVPKWYISMMGHKKNRKCNCLSLVFCRFSL